MTSSEKGDQVSYSRRVFFRRTALALGGLFAFATAGSKLLPNQGNGSEFPGPNSIYQPRQDVLLRYWRDKLRRLRLR